MPRKSRPVPTGPQWRTAPGLGSGSTALRDHSDEPEPETRSDERASRVRAAPTSVIGRRSAAPAPADDRDDRDSGPGTADTTDEPELARPQRRLDGELPRFRTNGSGDGSGQRNGASRDGDADPRNGSAQDPGPDRQSGFAPRSGSARANGTAPHDGSAEPSGTDRYNGSDQHNGSDRYNGSERYNGSDRYRGSDRYDAAPGDGPAGRYRTGAQYGSAAQYPSASDNGAGRQYEAAPQYGARPDGGSEYGSTPEPASDDRRALVRRSSMRESFTRSVRSLEPISDLEAAAFAGRFAADFQSFDEDNPAHRATVLRSLLADPQASTWGWSGRGRQRADSPLPGRLFRSSDTVVFVEVLVRATTYARSRGASMPEVPTTDYDEPVGIVGPSSVPPEADPRWVAVEANWVRMTVPITRSPDDGRLVVDPLLVPEQTA
ncbi:hypothetical protein [Pseudonocardia sp. HH130630-07]|uniref:hypothetical protein n=1 Tax=Pseudonocardia sp. HH130630-07 TaxID=1690815 RepID=UPI000A5160D2|nr:hypothetical protein [Pseudonocardia sp. HH130630-07]